MTEPSFQQGSVRVYLGQKSGKYPDGNQVVVTGADTQVAFDMPLVARALEGAFDEVDAVILGHVHEDHVAGRAMRQRSSVGSRR
jgi:glyoxylase-like metal-dependent hydrolase (beta-lactamase superfamily II)